MGVHSGKRLFISIIIIVMLYFFLYAAVQQRILSSNVYDSYTLQAVQWWKGQISLDGDYPWLELAYYDNNVYLSFPPFPSVIMFLLVPFFGPNTPSNLMNSLYALLSFIVLFKFCKRKEMSDIASILWSTFVVYGSNLLGISLFGGVWYQAQALGFLMTILSLYLITSEEAWQWHASMVCWAFAVGCRPFQIIYFPVYVLLLLKNIQKKQLSKVIVFKFLFLPMCIGCLYALYNYVRFDSVFEFGHNYLPEFVNADFGQFHVSYIFKNLPNIFRMPYFDKDVLSFPKYDGFAFYIANPIFVVYIIHWLTNGKDYLSVQNVMIGIIAILHILLFLSHKTLGGWQFGIRYFIDIIPFIAFSLLQKRTQVKAYHIVLLSFAVMLNIYGVLWLVLEW